MNVQIDNVVHTVTRNDLRDYTVADNQGAEFIVFWRGGEWHYERITQHPRGRWARLNPNVQHRLCLRLKQAVETAESNPNFGA